MGGQRIWRCGALVPRKRNVCVREESEEEEGNECLRVQKSGRTGSEPGNRSNLSLYRGGGEGNYRDAMEVRGTYKCWIWTIHA